MNKIIALLLLTLSISQVSSLQIGDEIQQTWRNDAGIGEYGSFKGTVEQGGIETGDLIIRVNFQKNKFSLVESGPFFQYYSMSDGKIFFVVKREKSEISKEDIAPLIIEEIKKQ